MREIEPGEDLHDVAKQIGGAEAEGFAIRFIEGPRTFLNWQAGEIVAQRLLYRGQGMSDPVDTTVSFFRLLGYGATQQAAIENARKNKHWRNGRAL